MLNSANLGGIIYDAPENSTTRRKNDTIFIFMFCKIEVVTKCSKFPYVIWFFCTVTQRDVKMNLNSKDERHLNTTMFFKGKQSRNSRIWAHCCESTPPGFPVANKVLVSGSPKTIIIILLRVIVTWQVTPISILLTKQHHPIMDPPPELEALDG